jgi:hypothetical protein
MSAREDIKAMTEKRRRVQHHIDMEISQQGFKGDPRPARGALRGNVPRHAQEAPQGQEGSAESQLALVTLLRSSLSSHSTSNYNLRTTVRTCNG